MWAALWARVQGWLWMAGAVLAVLVGAYTAGGRAARRSVEVDQARTQKQAQEKVRHVENTVNQADDDSVVRRLDKWVRDNSR